jgi:hypothetical protein
MSDTGTMRIENHILKTELLDIDQLTPLQGGLKKLSDENFNKLRQSLIDKGFQFTVHVWESGGVTYIIDGHQRVHVMKQLRKAGWDIPPITCAFVKAATYHEAKELILYSVSQFGKIDQDGFTEFTEGEGFDFAKFDLPDFQIDLPDIPMDLASEDQGEYSRKVDAPIYEPKLERAPPITDLYDQNKTEHLISEINDSPIPSELKNFLKAAAYRHTVFNYEAIAEYYAHASPEVQNLMESSALVIIDFNKAIENGFIVLSNEIAKSFIDQNNTDGSSEDYDDDGYEE